MQACGLGEILWDVFSDKERLGGAALNFCSSLQRLGNQATLLSVVGDDDRGRRATERMHSLGLDTTGICTVEDLPTGTAVVSKRDDEPVFEIHRPAAFDRISTALSPSLQTHKTDWIYFGTLLQIQPETENFTANLVRSLRPARVFYDMNLRAGHWNLSLVQRLCPLASVLKLNEAEAATLFRATYPQSHHPFSLELFCREWASEYEIDVICVTLGSAGCVIYDHGDLFEESGYKITVSDTVGSGDAFAAAFLHGYHLGWPIRQTAQFANAAGALIASLPGATPDWTLDDILRITREGK